MKKVAQKLVALALVLCMSTAILPIGVKAEDNPGALTMENFGLKWTGGSDKTVISEDGKSFTLTPSSNSDSLVKAEVSFSKGGDEVIDIGKAEIRLPLHVIMDREGNPIDTIEMSIPKAPATGGQTIFNYWIDEDKQEVVLTNYAQIPAGSFFMKAEMTWNFNSFEVESGADLNAVQANISITGIDGSAPLTKTTDEIGGQVITSVKSWDPSKEQSAKKESWQDEWGEKPADADDFFYVVWEVRQKYDTLQTTSPYTVYFEDIPGNGGGEPVAWKNTGGPDVDESFRQPDSSSAKSSLEQMNEDPVGTISTLEDAKDSEKTEFTRTIVMKYPRSLTADGATPYLSNKINAKTVPFEGEITEKVALGSYTYQTVSMGVNYGGDEFSMYKRADKDWDEKKLRKRTAFVGALNVLRNGTPVEAAWSIDVKNMSWNRTDNGKETYDTVLRDGMMYVGGERLLPGDYELSKFYPSQYDVYGPAYTEDLGWFLDIYSDYTNEECYAPITVYVEDEEGNWSEFGQVKKTGEKTYSWTDLDGNVTENIDYKTPVDLPEGTQDIKYVHTDNAYGVEYRMSLYYKLKPSEHLMGLIGENTTNFNLININEAWGEQNGTIYTPGNEFDDESTKTIKEDVEKSDNEEFAGRFEKDTDGIAHDYSEHSFTSVTVKSDFKKTLGTVKNNQKNERVEIPVELAYNAYVAYKSLGITLEEAVEANLVDPCNEMVFYDLLPAGATVDPQRVFAKSYFGQNLDGRNEAFERTVELVDNWRGSGRTMMIIRVNTPDGYRNFANSPSYLETGIKVTFTMYNSYANMAVNGTEVQNDAAAFSMDGPIPNGVSDTGEGSKDPDLFSNLGESAGNSDLENNVRYSSAKKNVVIPMASQMGFSKKVKGAGDLSYGKNATVPANGDYSYEMRFAIAEGNAAKGIVLYDVLETAYGDKPYWAGTFKSVETASIKAQFPDTDPVVYYSTSTAFGKLDASTGIDYTDLSNTNLWTTELPEDVTKVTAVAVDLRKDVDGKDKVFEGEIALAAHIYMEAPGNYQDYVDNPETTENDPVYAYNQAFIKQEGKEPEGSEITTVEVTKPDMKIVKSSDPKGGATSAKATEVIVGDTIVYTLDVSNKNSGDVTEGIKVTDVIPDHLTIDTENLTYYFGGQSSSKKVADGSGRVKGTADGQTVTFEIDKLSILEVVHLCIPVTVSDDAEAEEVFTNIARISEFDGQEWDDEYESNETNHKAISVTLSFPVSKALEGADRPEEKDFTFTLSSENSPLPETTYVTITGEGDATFPEITFMSPGEYTYTISEEAKPDSGYDGYTFDTESHEIVVTVEEVEEKLVASWTDNGEEVDTVAFTNTYAPIETELALPVTKIVSGNERPEEKDFTFVLTGEDDAPMPENNEITITGEGTAEFEAIPFTETGVYYYSVSETAGSEYGYTYSKAVSYVTVTVTDEDGSLNATYTVSTKEDGQDAVEADSIIFTNDYKPDEVSVNLPVIKKIEGHERVEEKEFVFVLATGTNAPMPAEGNEVMITGEGREEFGTITYTEAGTYTYTISETNTDEKAYTYDDTEYTVTVSVKDIEGVLSAGWKIEGNEEDSPAAVFTNTYAPSETQLVLPVEKKIEGDERPTEADFTFVLTGDDDAPMPESNEVIIHGEGSAEFGEITYTEAGTYKYAVTERNTGEKGYTYDKSVYHITVTVMDENGELKAVYAYDEETPVFVNTYEKPKTVVETGYESHTMIWTMLCISGLLGMFAILKNRRNA